MIRVHAEPARTCNGCGARTSVTLLVIGASHIRVCGPCWDKLGTARVKLYLHGLDSVEVS